ncbi:MAG: bifunctional alpha/beta hydrolase/OsmC family protein [Hasllibacter sp.]
MPTERFAFPGHSGHALAARLDLPDGPPRGAALFAHCFTCGKDIAAARRIAGRLAAAGIAVLRFDFTGLGHSEGEFANTDFETNALDLIAAAEAMAARGLAPGLLIGHSLGGAAAIAAGGRIASVKAVVTIGAPFDPAHVRDQFSEQLDRIEADGQAAVRLGPREVVIGRRFVRQIAEARQEGAVGTLGKALLVMHSPTDAVVGIDNASGIYLAARHPKSFVALDGADHLLTRAEDAEWAAEVIGTWAARHMTLAPPEAPEGAPEGVTRVSEADSKGSTQDVAMGRHLAVADEPKGIGADLGPSPYQYLAAGLGACTSMTVRMYARRKGWPLAHVSVDVTHDRLHGEDIAGDGRAELFRRTVRLEGELSRDQRARLMQIADRCPVHRTLERGAVVETVEREGAPEGAPV